MNKRPIVYIACALALSGCSIFHKDSSPPNPVQPQVFVVDGRLIVVNAEPLVFTRRGAVTITWHLPRGSNYAFAEQGIVIEGLLVGQTKVPRVGLIHQTYVLDPKQDEIKCSPGKDGSEFSCVNRNSKPGRYKYTIRVRGGTKVEPLDPWLVND